MAASEGFNINPLNPIASSGQAVFQRAHLVSASSFAADFCEASAMAVLAANSCFQTFHGCHHASKFSQFTGGRW